MTVDFDSIILLISVVQELRKPGVGPNKVIEATFNAHAMWVGPVSGPITRSTLEINDFNEWIVNFSQILTFEASVLISSANSFEVGFN